MKSNAERVGKLLYKEIDQVIEKWASDDGNDPYSFKEEFRKDLEYLVMASMMAVSIASKGDK